MKKEWFYLKELCSFCKEPLFSFLPPHEVNGLNFCCEECGDDHNINLTKENIK